jgi:hypothetical protein
MSATIDAQTWRLYRLKGLLVGYYGAERAVQIMTGQDAATERDLAVWRAFGQSKCVAL